MDIFSTILAFASLDVRQSRDIEKFRLMRSDRRQRRVICRLFRCNRPAPQSECPQGCGGNCGESPQQATETDNKDTRKRGIGLSRALS